MKILTLSLYMGLLVVETSYEGHSFGENQLGQANEFYQPAFTIDETEFSMFPQEKEFDSFSNAGIEAESDPQVLSDYYQTVADTYRNWANQQKNLVQASQANVIGSRENIFWKNNKASDFRSYNSLAQSRYQAVNYQKDYYVKENKKFQLMDKKAEFYQEIADNYKFLAS